MNVPFDPISIIRLLAEHEIDCVLVGGFAALHGSPLDHQRRRHHARDVTTNLEHVSSALRVLDARLRVASEPDGVPFEPHPALLASMRALNTTTTFGDLDLTISPGGVDDDESLKSAATDFEIEGSTILVASLDDVIRSKEAADRPKDHATLQLLHALRDEIERS